MLAVKSCSPKICISVLRWQICVRVRTLVRCRGGGPIVPRRISSSGDRQLDYDPSRDLLELEVDIQSRKFISESPKLRSWFGPNGQYIRELPCPTCRGRGYTPCTECGIEGPRADCSECNGKGLKTCQKCLGDCVIWEESIDERPWEKARSSSPLKVKEDDDVDNLDIEVAVARKSKRVYQSPSPEVGRKISRSLKSLNAKTGLFSKRMRIIHRNPTLHAQRVAAIKKTKGTPEARKQASEAMKAFFSDPENRKSRSLSMKGVKYFCSHCGEEGHRRHYCPSLSKGSGKRQFHCRICGEEGHNKRTCPKNVARAESCQHRCKLCGQEGHNRRTCSLRKSTSNKVKVNLISDSLKTYSCRICLGKGHNSRTCLRKEDHNLN
ncbi:zinc knuckle (CCHC-type) family protein [Wolffia australiana]